MFNVSKVWHANDNSTADIVINQGGTDCFKGSQLVKTVSGSKPISDLKLGDFVLSHDLITKQNVFKPIIKVFRYQNQKKTVCIKLKNGKTITCTEDHNFFFKGRWQSAGKILSLLNGNMENNTKL